MALGGSRLTPSGGSGKFPLKKKSLSENVASPLMRGLRDKIAKKNFILYNLYKFHLFLGDSPCFLNV